MAGRVNITHPDGRSYAVFPDDFAKGADGDYKGFKITTYESGEPYEGPKTAGAISRAQDAPAKAEKAQDEPKGGN